MELTSGVTIVAVLRGAWFQATLAVVRVRLVMPLSARTPCVKVSPSAAAWPSMTYVASAPELPKRVKVIVAEVMVAPAGTVTPA